VSSSNCCPSTFASAEVFSSSKADSVWGFNHLLMLWWVDAEDSSIKKLTGSGIFSSSNSLMVGWRFILEGT
jgi:hypothetical protein